MCIKVLSLAPLFKNVEGQLRVGYPCIVLLWSFVLNVLKEFLEFYRCDQVFHHT